MADVRMSPTPFLTKEDCLFVVIDMQERLVPAMGQKEKLVENVLRLVRFAGIMGIPLVLTEQEKLGATLPEIRSEWKEAEPIVKVHFDCFGSEPFKRQVRDLKRKALVLAGIEAHICVAQTALHGVADYTVHVVSDATSSRSAHNWDIAQERMRQSGITITTTEMLIYEVLGRAGTDTFKEVLKLVK